MALAWREAGGPMGEAPSPAVPGLQWNGAGGEVELIPLIWRFGCVC